MKNQAWKKHDIHIQPGTVIKGKWHKKSYIVKKRLGQGAVGTVYLCEAGGRQAALKISDQGTSMTVEVNVLKALQKVQGSHLGPYLLDVDDWQTARGRTYSFYVMEYLQGESIASFMKRNGSEWTGVFMLQLLEDLGKLHQSGWVFGDLKTENLIVVSSPSRIRWVDVGGTTQIGRAIKEYTEFYDRGYWGLGTRRAEPSYDLFALVMVFLTVFYPDRFAKTANPEQTISKKINDVKALKTYRSPLKKAIAGGYQSSDQMKQDIKRILYSRQKRRRTKKKTDKTVKLPFFIESGGILILALGYYFASYLIP